MSVLDPKNLLAGIDWRARKQFLELARRFQAQTGLVLKVRSGRRTCAEQNDLYGIGRRYNLGSKPVTHVAGCRSWHVLGRAIDADPADPQTGKVSMTTASCANATKAGLLWEQLGGRWGGRFGGFGECGDQGHFEWTRDVTMAALCPSPTHCNENELQIATVQPATAAPWMWGVAGFAAVAGVAWLVTRRG